MDRQLWNLDAEQVTLGAMMMAPAQIDVVVGCLHGFDDFFRPAHQLIFSVIVALAGRGDPVDPVAVLNELQAWGDADKAGGGPYLHTLVAGVPSAANAGYYARIVADLAARRRVIEMTERAAARARDLATDVPQVLAGVEEDLHGVRAEPSLTVPDIDEFSRQQLPFSDPVIPGLIHQQERLIVVADEGAGKSELGLAAGVMTAAGLHVFTCDPIPCQRSVIIDLENPSASLQRRTTRLLRLAEGTYGWDPDRCHVLSRPGGLDLRDAGDQRLLMNVIEKTQPALIVAGPVYKMTVDRGERAEQLHTTVTGFLDKIRERFGCAMWLEAHAPLPQGGRVRDMRPMGSGVWSRWPEFGLGLRHSADPLDPPYTLLVEQFRGHREDRVWPKALQRGHPWPWAGEYSHGTRS